MEKSTQVIIAGAGAGGLILALSLHQIGVDCRVYEAVPDIRPIGAGINLLPHAVRELDELDLVPALDKVGIRTKDASYFTHHGQLVYTEPAGEAAGYPWPQFSIHRGDMQFTFLDAVRERLGPDSVQTGHRLVKVDQDEDGVTAHFVDPEGNALPPVRGGMLVGADGIKSALRKQFYPDEGEPIYSGLTIWRGVTPFKPFLSGANTIRIGWMSVGKLMVYPIRNNIDAEGNQLMNWVATLERPKPESYDWNRHASLDDFFEPYKNWHFDWLDVPALLQKTDPILIFPMVDRDPLKTWTFGRATLLGDAAHPMYPRGSNGAGQAILDARFLAGCIKRMGVGAEALQAYDKERVAATSKVVLMNRKNPPDAILREVHERSGGRKFDHINDVISVDELKSISSNYKQVAGFDIEQLKARPAFV
ncbi:flavin-dependent oxidoreductase [Pelagibacterium lacus]|uniref:Flavin-dependent oxidoreductase n=1 Tax=Pelagibacterium lacus TaxID=2282655 RepID=A0A369VZX1_9HYPH|nr:flavin-dependent oxidoreductase [Pelagibacterium lacus]RDE07858.1 flavin-dependent oxidoreductase [Pelagibacterium lacus]